MTELGLTYTDEEWPHGLRCIDCGVLFVEGMRYSERLISISHADDTPWRETTSLVHIICVPCAPKGEAS